MCGCFEILQGRVGNSLKDVQHSVAQQETPLLPLKNEYKYCHERSHIH